MPNDVADWTGQNLVQIISSNGDLLGDVGSATQAADSGTESVTTSGTISSSTAAIASLKTTGAAALIAAGAVVEGTPTAVNPAYGAVPAAGHALIAVVTAYGVDATTVTPGWALIAPSNPGGAGTRLAIWAKLNSVGGDAAPAFTSTGVTANMQAGLIELSNVALAAATDQTGGIFQPTAATSIVVAAGGIDALAGDVVVMGVHWRGFGGAFTASFTEFFNNLIPATRATDNGGSSGTDHTVISIGVVPPLPPTLPVGVRPWDYDAMGTSSPAVGTAASVTLAAVPGKAYRVAMLSTSKVQTAAAAGNSGLLLQDGATTVFARVGGVAAGAGNSLGLELAGMGLKLTEGNSVTLKYAAADAGIAQAVNIGAYLQ